CRFSEMADGVLTKAPQVLVKAAVPAKPPLEQLPGVQAQIARTREVLGDEALINVRYSGTEPVVRVMIQGNDQTVEVLNREAEKILEAVVAETGDQ
ncbi:MAG: phosphoglucosamine mutase, partial [Anaerolineae bacterium]|nr:phosphoglucosamine mutase [Anaerolineae bacterium]